jgi:hypothetical protein
LTEPIPPKRRPLPLSLLPLLLVLSFGGLSPVSASAPGPAVRAIQARSQVAKLPLGGSKITVVRLIDRHIKRALHKMHHWDRRLSFERRRIKKFAAVLARTPAVSGPSAAQAAAGLRSALSRDQQAWKQRISIRHYIGRFEKSRATVVAALHGAGVSGLKPGPVTYRRWAWAFLGALGAPTCSNNVRLVVSWETAESTSSRFNPLATTYWLPGAMTYGKSHIENYYSFAQGVQASRDTLIASPDSYNYAPVVDDLLTCAPTQRTANDIRASEWCHGCTGGSYLVAVLPSVREDWEGHESRHVGGG